MSETLVTKLTRAFDKFSAESDALVDEEVKRLVASGISEDAAKMMAFNDILTVTSNVDNSHFGTNTSKRPS